MKTLASAAILLALVLTPTLAAQQAVTGKWNATLTRTAPDGQTQSISFRLDLTQKGKVLTGTIAPDADRIWPIEKGVVDGGRVEFQVQQPNGPMRTFKLTVVKEGLQGTMVAELNGQSFETTVEAERAR
jgi:hypothetical protein